MGHLCVFFPVNDPPEVPGKKKTPTHAAIRGLCFGVFFSTSDLVLGGPESGGAPNLTPRVSLGKV